MSVCKVSICVRVGFRQQMKKTTLPMRTFDDVEIVLVVRGLCCAMIRLDRVEQEGWVELREVLPEVGCQRLERAWPTWLVDLVGESG